MFKGSDGILVYRYTYGEDGESESTEYATLETIRSIGKPLHASAKRVAASEVINGFYVPERVKPA